MAVPRARLGGPFGGPSIRTRNELSIEPILDAVSRGATGLIQNAYLRKRQKQQDEMIAAEKAAAQAQAVQDRLERVQTEDRRYQLDLRKLTSDEARQRAADEKAARDEAAKLIAPVGRMTDPVDGTVYNIDAQGRASPAVTTDGQPFRLKVPPRPGTSTTRNIDPLSPEGIRASGERAAAQAAAQAARGAGAAGAAERFKRDLAVKNTGDALDRYERTFDAIGTRLLPGMEKSVLQTEYRNVLLQLKELYNLGVLNGPDLVLMEQVLTDPSSLSQFRAGLTPEERSRSIKAQIRRVRDQLQATARNLQVQPPQSQQQLPPQPPGFGSNAPPGAPPTAPPVPPADTSSVPPVGPNMIRLKNGTVVPIRR